MRVLGIEGTAWCASAAVYEVDRTALGDPGAGAVEMFSEAYRPESGGIHPREAAEHMREAVPAVVERALAAADGPLDAVAFSRGPGLGPCLRIVGTAARSLAATLECPLVGVNHMVAHLEIGRHAAGFEAPVCLNASGANAHVLGYRNGRYRVLGETMDTGVGNAIDKFTRHVGWSHPGGPKVEARAADGGYVELPYVVKGMDFSFAGISSAAQEAYDAGTPVEDVCRGLQETVFAMLAEVSERALALTGRAELVLGGGVGQNDRLREMLAAMCDERGAAFHAPDPRFLRDNAGMIAVLGAKMYAAGDTLAIEDSAIDPDFRPDEVPVTWRTPEAEAQASPSLASASAARGAEAVVSLDADPDRVTKRRPRKAYRHPALDDRLRRERTVIEARLTSDARRRGVPTPVVFDVDVLERRLSLERVGDRDLRDALSVGRVRTLAGHLATLHAAGLVHGDPTVRNARVRGAEEEGEGAGSGNGDGDRDGDGGAPEAGSDPGRERVFLIDFGLGYHSDDPEDHAMDLHVLRQSLSGTADDAAPLLEAVVEGYRASAADADDAAAALDRLREVEGRGRYR
jgi:N6-L-threonylcarbamoyladenine synthase/protein kinase Bud32